MAVKRVTLAPFDERPSPAFTARYPEIINPNRLHPDARALMEPRWIKGKFDEQPVKIFHLKDVFVTAENLILDRQFQFIENACDLYSDTELATALANIQRQFDAGRLIQHRSGILAKRRAASNYGHFLMEMLPMAIIGEPYFHDRDHWHVVHRVDPPLQDVMFRAFRLLGFPLSRLLVTDADEVVHFEELIVVRGLTEHGYYMSPLCVQVVETLGAMIPAGVKRKLFIRRRPGWNRGRSLLNEDELSARLAAKGFAVAEPGSMTLEQQISLFRGASHVIGVSGAAMTNIVFCNPDTKITLLVPDRFPDIFFWLIAAHKRLHYVELRAEQKAADGDDHWKADFSLSESDIRYLEDNPSATQPVPHVIATAHIQNIGDVVAGPHEWIGTPGSGRWVEGFSITPQDDITNDEIEYQAVLGANSVSSWIKGGILCGTRGLSQPLLGFRIRLLGSAGRRYDCHYAATFLDGSSKTTIPAGALCVSDALAPLEAFQITLTRRAV